MLVDQTQVKQFVRGVGMGARIHGRLHPSWNHTCFSLHPDVCYSTVLTMAKGISEVLLAQMRQWLALPGEDQEGFREKRA